MKKRGQAGLGLVKKQAQVITLEEGENHETRSCLVDIHLSRCWTHKCSLSTRTALRPAWWNRAPTTLKCQQSSYSSSRHGKSQVFGVPRGCLKDQPGRTAVQKADPKGDYENAADPERCIFRLHWPLQQAIGWYRGLNLKCILWLKLIVFRSAGF